jgi:hypothetical protein
MVKAAGLFLIAGLVLAPTAHADGPAVASSPVKVDLVFTGGHETDPRDHGRPVTLIASALGVPPDVFREAFSHVHPAPPGAPPTEDQVRQNKHELMSRLAPYGVTDERLNEVSNYYRYRNWAGEIWRHTDAAGYAMVQGGKVVSITMTNPGAGYSSAPMVSTPGAGLTVYPLARLAFGTDLGKNGSIAKIDLAPLGDIPPLTTPSSRSSGVIITTQGSQGEPPPQPPPPPQSH